MKYKEKPEILIPKGYRADELCGACGGTDSQTETKGELFWRKNRKTRRRVSLRRGAFA